MRKARERAILETVYDVDQFGTVCESESPDFRLRHQNEGECFGVEVTEFYLFESDTRIKNIPGICLNYSPEASLDTKTT
jgi:hypothetical protein